MQKTILLIRAIAVYYWAVGLLYTVAVYWPLLSPSEVTVNLGYGLWAGFCLCLGYGLFRLYEWGRKFTLALLVVQILWNAGSYILLTLFSNMSWYALKFWDKPILELKGHVLATLPYFAWMVFHLLLAAFLWQKGTRDAFLPKQAVTVSAPLAEGPLEKS